MPQISLYIPKAIDEEWRKASPDARDAITAAMRSLLRRRLVTPTAEEAKMPERELGQ